VRYVTRSEFDYWQKKKEEEILRRKEEEANKGKKKDTKGKAATDDKPPVFNTNEDADVPLEEIVAEPEHKMLEKTERTI